MKDFDYLKNLNENQLRAVTTDLGAKLIVAGAGSGKTKVLTLRCAYLINKYNIPANKILCITFTNKAANEMKIRLQEILPEENFRWVNTFHGLCLQILRQDIDKLNYDKNFNILDEEDQISIIKEAYKQYAVDNKDIPYKNALSLIDKYKNYEFSLQDFDNTNMWSSLSIKDAKDANKKRIIVEYYLNKCKEINALDFNDLLILTNKLFKENKDVLEKWANTFDYVLIDEFQDTNDAQYNLIKNLISKKQNIFVVGDPDQTIYTWRGANQKIINEFAKNFNECEVIILNTNYRSYQSILDVANSLIKNNSYRYDKDLFSYRELGTKPIYFNANNQDEESKWVVLKIIDLLKDKNNNLNDICILYRSNYLSRNIEQELLLNNIPYVIYGGIRFYQRREIKDIIAYLKTIFLGDELSIKRIINVPKRGISQNSIDEITNYAKKHNISFLNAILQIDNINISSIAKKGVKEFIHLLQSIEDTKSLSSVLEEVIEKTKYIDYLASIDEYDRIKNINELKGSIIKYEKENPNNNFSDYLQEISLFSEQEIKNKNNVSLMTVHSSKGLEFKHVFIIGLNEGMFPSTKNNEKLAIEEERRVAYVAITRARDNLFLSSFQGINYITNNLNRPSRFIDEINNELLDVDQHKIKSLSKNDNEWFDSQKKIDYKQNFRSREEVDFKLGDTVIHEKYGEGIIIKINGDLIDVSFKNPRVVKTIVSNHRSIRRKIVLN